MNAVSKKKLQEKNTKLSNKLKSKGEDKAVLVRRLKDAELAELYWQDHAAKAEEALAGTHINASMRVKRRLTFTRTTYTHIPTTDLKSKTHPFPWMSGMVKQRTEADAQSGHYPPELILMSLSLMANGKPASQVNADITTVLSGGENFDTDRYRWPDQTTHRRWRFGITHVCQVQIGMELTRAANNKKQVLTGDGTPVNGKHVESFVITTDDVKIAMIPWVQAGKGSELSAENTVKMINRCQRAYDDWCARTHTHIHVCVHPFSCKHVQTRVHTHTGTRNAPTRRVFQLL